MPTTEQTTTEPREPLRPARNLYRPIRRPTGTSTPSSAEREPDMTHEQALALRAAGGGGHRNVLTDRGWVRVEGS